MSYKLEKPYNDVQYAEFISKYNHNLGLKIAEATDILYALEADEIIAGDEVIKNPEYENEKLEKAQAQKLAENATALEKKDSFSTSLGSVKIQTPVGRIDVVVTSMLNIVNITQANLPEGFLRVYIEGVETPSPEMTPQQVGGFYLEIAQKLKALDTLYKSYETAINESQTLEDLEAIEIEYGGI